MSKEKRRVPKLRFPGFTEDWEQRKADYIFKSVTDKGYPELPVLSASQELGMVYREQNGIDIQHNKKNEASYKRVLPGQFVIHLRSFQGGFAYSEVEGITSPAYTVMSFKNSNEQYGLFWKHIFKSEIFIKRLETITYGIRDGRSISFSDFKSLILQYPSFSEQKMIGDSIAIIERGITLHQRKLEHLNLKKKALLQKLFPKNGERYPELRFPGFTDAWEQRKFKDLFIERREKTIRENEETLLSCAITGIYLNAELFSHFRGSSTIGYLKIKKYDLILSAQNLHLGNANINLSFDKGMISPAYKVFELNSIDPYFINAWVKKDSTKNFFLKATTEGASQCRKNIEWDVLLNQEIPVPNKLEQRTIGRFINNIDMIITLHQRKLEHLQLQKKALLQQMFV